jgi:phosphocarrier protein
LLTAAVVFDFYIGGLYMKEHNCIIQDPAGIHARPAGVLAKTAQRYKSEITVTKGEKTASLKKVFALMGLAVKQNEGVTIRFEGQDEDDALAAIKQALQEEKLV